MSKSRYIRKRDKAILLHISNGLTATETGTQVFLSGRTIEKRVENLKKTLKAKNITHLIALALRKKLIQ